MDITIPKTPVEKIEREKAGVKRNFYLVFIIN